MNEKPLRTFLALPLAELFLSDIQYALAKLKNKVGGVRWVAPEQVHITLHFFGQTTPQEVEHIDRLMTAIVAKFSALRIGLSNIGAFPDFNRPRVIWLGLEGDIERLRALHQETETVLGNAGFPLEDRSFHPHATLGRIKQGTHASIPPQKNLQLPEVKTGPQLINHLILFQSHLGHEGPRYEAIKTFSFAQPSSA